MRQYCFSIKRSHFGEKSLSHIRSWTQLILNSDLINEFYLNRFFFYSAYNQVLSHWLTSRRKPPPNLPFKNKSTALVFFQKHTYLCEIMYTFNTWTNQSIAFSTSIRLASKMVWFSKELDIEYLFVYFINKSMESLERLSYGSRGLTAAY